MDREKDANIQEVERKVEEVKLVMVDNIDKMMERGERIHLLDNKTAFLSDSATRFKTQAKHMKHSMCVEHKKEMVYGLIGFVAVLLLLIWIMQSNKQT